MIMLVLLATPFLRIIWVSSFSVLQGGWLSLSIPVRKIISSPLRVWKHLCSSDQGRPCSWFLLVLIKQMRACPIALLQLTPSSEWILNATKGKHVKICSTELRKCYAYLILFLFQGPGTLFILELRIEGLQKWRLDAEQMRNHLCLLILVEQLVAL